MLEELVKLFEELFSPESSWSKAFRKTFFIILIPLILYGGYTTYTNIELKKQIPVEELIEKKDKLDEELEDLLQTYFVQKKNVASVWIYGWTNGRKLTPIKHVGQNDNPIPFGYLRDSDITQIGSLILGSCTNLERPINNRTCPIIANGKAVGLMVVAYKIDNYTPSDKCLAAVAAISHKIGSLIHTYYLH